MPVSDGGKPQLLLPATLLVRGSMGPPPGAAFRRDVGLAPQGWPQTGCRCESSGPPCCALLLSASLE